MEMMRAGRRIMVIDADLAVHKALDTAFRRENCSIISVYSGEEALDCIRRSQPDALVMDVVLPSKDGFTLCRELRKESDVPIIMLSSKTEEFDRLLGIELGADDYLTKPFSAREVVAHTKAILRRIYTISEAEAGLQFAADNLEIDMNAYTVRLDGCVVPCTPKEIEIIHLLAKSPGTVFSRESLLKTIWGYTYLGDTRAVDSHIKRIRAKLCREHNGWDIRTVWGVGYRFELKNEH